MGQQAKKKPSLTADEVGQLDSDYKDVFMRRLATDMQAEGVAPNDLKKRFGLAKDSLDRLLPEYKLLLSRFDLSLYSYCQEALTARYLHSKQIGSDQIIQTSSSSHNIIEVDEAAVAAAAEAHRRRWKEMQRQELHKASREKLGNVMELIRSEERPVQAFPEGGTNSENGAADLGTSGSGGASGVGASADGGATVTGDRGAGA
ncbi:hypothetical protein BOX15_Mlig033027g3 [Macrostomum lignano]|uniref:Uncharacterized protein n=1 Tax=Macrostomum lignano TaxID=282301 RepID=A0A267FJI5_9PLAT|nr:hypothetical protein BOX15_Mlig033027g3 [Macrostomum lignano]